jgi:hypothetical protein
LQTEHALTTKRDISPEAPQTPSNLHVDTVGTTTTPSLNPNRQQKAILDVNIGEYAISDEATEAVQRGEKGLAIYDKSIFVSTTGGALRTAAATLAKEADAAAAAAAASSATAGTGGSAHGDHTKPTSDSHLARDQLTNVSVAVADAPISLAKLQHFMRRTMLAYKLVRMKGVLWVDDCSAGLGEGASGEGVVAKVGGLRRMRCVVHMSGRGRLGFELDGAWSGPPSSMVAFIGPALDQAQLTAAFRALAVPAPPAEPAAPDQAETGAGAETDTTQRWEQLAAVVRASPLFEMGPGTAGPCLWFRATGHRTYVCFSRFRPTFLQRSLAVT